MALLTDLVKNDFGSHQKIWCLPVKIFADKDCARSSFGTKLLVNLFKTLFSMLNASSQAFRDSTKKLWTAAHKLQSNLDAAVYKNATVDLDESLFSDA